jgi:hypothetical protein
VHGKIITIFPCTQKKPFLTVCVGKDRMIRKLPGEAFIASQEQRPVVSPLHRGLFGIVPQWFMGLQ